MNLLELFSFLLSNAEPIITNDVEPNVYCRYGAILLLNIAAYSYLSLKFYKLICYSKLTFEWLPLVNPFVWPFSTFQAVTKPYFKFWAKLFPPIKFEKATVQISSIIALEAINSLLFFLVKLSNVLVLYLERTEHAANLF